MTAVGIATATLIGIALLVWMYLISLVILIGAEFNAILFPRSLLGSELAAGAVK